MNVNQIWSQHSLVCSGLNLVVLVAILIPQSLGKENKERKGVKGKTRGD